MLNKELLEASYLSFATFKRSGAAVRTPVWAGPDGDSVYMFSEAAAGKIKRLRNFSRSELAPCTVTGRVTGGWYAAEAHILSEPADIELAYKALYKKYGLLMRLTDFSSKLFGRYHSRALIRVDVGEALSQGSATEV